MPTASTTPLAELETKEIIEPKKKDRQVFRRAIKRDYNRQNFYQKTR